MKILQSNNAFEMALPELKLKGGKILPSVILPKRAYRDGEVYVRGPRQNMKPRPFIELTEEEVERINAGDNAAKQVQSMMARGVYVWLDAIPESLKTSQDLIPELREESAKDKQRIAELEAELAALKAPKTETTAETATVVEPEPSKMRKRKSGPVDPEKKDG